MKWIKDRITFGNILTITILVFGIAGSSVTTYYTVVYTGKTNTAKIENANARMQNLNERVQTLNEKLQQRNQDWDNLIMKLDQRYVGTKAFKEFKESINTQLNDIKQDTKYLVRHSGGG